MKTDRQSVTSTAYSFGYSSSGTMTLWINASLLSGLTPAILVQHTLPNLALCLAHVGFNLELVCLSMSAFIAEIPRNPEACASVLDKIFGYKSKVLQKKISETLLSQVGAVQPPNTLDFSASPAACKDQVSLHDGSGTATTLGNKAGTMLACYRSSCSTWLLSGSVFRMIRRMLRLVVLRT